MGSRWKFSTDIKLIRIVFLLCCISYILSVNIGVFNNPNVFGGITANGKAYNISIYRFLEIELPIVITLLTILLFSADTKANTFELLLSLPVKRSGIIAYRFFRIFAIFTGIFIISSVNFTYSINLYLSSHKIEKISYLGTIILTLPASFFLAALALFITILTRNIIYSLTISMGYWIFEYFSEGAFTKKLHLFIYYRGLYPLNNIIMNRIFYILIGVVLIYLSVWLTSNKYYLSSSNQNNISD